ncbi:DNA-binding GntR family transcriptional regulator [Streptomyces phaeochromogenes]|jgi:DNA-binding GntR family transcriptional regulator|uniref:GntR family transcriptional regulator n=1 Tax=Streptomyces phaeochromogenes TaxID=1923 RepID=UPI0027929580|nr:GntR family transcriptional regulator [Streptomyces phaeochromogenes]MDQ0948012.1 DNA-binding GntR family transcriptional regulator [Streptomyces phaeochromogenes]
MDDQGKVAPARRRGLADEVADRIREAIFSGAYAPGAQLREVELSAAMDVSRGPVREALRLLEREGLVHCAWHRGTTVTTLSADDVAELDSLRGALEELAVRQVIAHASDEDLAAIAKTAEVMEGAADVHEMVRRDIEFHDAVFAAAGHRRLADAWEAVRCQVHLFLLTRITHSTEGYLTSVPAEHRELVVALRTRDTEASLALFAAHRRRAVDVVSGTVATS